MNRKSKLQEIMSGSPTMSDRVHRAMSTDSYAVVKDPRGKRFVVTTEAGITKLNQALTRLNERRAVGR